MPGSTQNTNLLAGLNQVIQAINDLITQFGCPDTTVNLPAPVVNLYVNCGTTGGGGVGPGGGPIIEPEPEQPPTGEVPPGFPNDWTYQDYLAYKCRAANKIIDDLIATCNNMTTISGLAGVVGAAALYAFLQTSLLSGVLVGLMMVGFSAATAAAIIIAALVAIVLAGGGALAYFGNLADNLADDKEQIVCDLFESESAEGARTATEGHIDDAIQGIVGIDEWSSDKLNSIVKALMGYSVYNYLFTYDATVNLYVGSIDCDVCGEEPCAEGIIMITGTIQSSTVNQDGSVTYRFGSALDPGTPWRQAIQFKVRGEYGTGECAFSWVQGSESFPISPGAWNGYIYRCDHSSLLRGGLNDGTGAGPWKEYWLWSGYNNYFEYEVTINSLLCQ